MFIETLVMVLLLSMTFISLVRAVIGPSMLDRLIAINVIATKVTTLIVLVAFALNQDMFIDVAMVYALLGFIMSVGVSKFVFKGGLGS
ncbi:MAG: cation:proton antiporter [Erysipelotrichia bacterium]|jgi:multicomponent Na+:H+ antiporter subunit F|nr:cation:proton antiporter [Erysipelotrichia bacterium]